MGTALAAIFAAKAVPTMNSFYSAVEASTTRPSTVYLLLTPDPQAV
jgi:hypothetical protein